MVETLRKTVLGVILLFMASLAMTIFALMKVDVTQEFFRARERLEDQRHKQHYDRHVPTDRLLI